MRQSPDTAYWLRQAAERADAHDEPGTLAAIEQALLEILPILPNPGTLLLQATTDGVELAADRR